MNPRFLFSLLIVLAALGLVATGCVDDEKNPSGHGAVRGVILDDRGSPVEGVEITVGKHGTGDVSTSLTGADGHFFVPEVRVGMNVIKIAKFGYLEWLGEVSVGDTEVVDGLSYTIKKSVSDLTIIFTEPSAVTLAWRSTEKVPSHVEVEYYTLDLSGSREKHTFRFRDTDEKYQHTVVLSDIDPAVEYFYRIKINEFAFTPSASFKVGEMGFPAAVVMNSPAAIGTSAVALTWTASQDQDFAEYRVYRNAATVVDSRSVMIASFRGRDMTSHLDETVAPGTLYSYRVYVVDSDGYTSGSNTVSVRTYGEPNLPPSPVNLYPPVSVTTDSVTLQWGRSRDSDFDSYRVYYSDLAGVGESATLASSISNPAETIFTVTGLKPSTEYYFRVFVRDRGGLSTGSSEEYARTLDPVDPFPTAVSILEAVSISASSIRLTWTRSVDSDFASYGIVMAEGPGIGNDDSPRLLISERDRTQTFIAGLQDSKTYYFRVFVRDSAGQSTGSDEWSATTWDTEPPQADVVSVVPSFDGSPGDRHMVVTWSQVSINDFSAYLLYRGEAPGVTPDSSGAVLVATISAMATGTFQDYGVTEGKTYYYRIYVRDAAGNTTPGVEKYATAMSSTAFSGNILVDTLWSAGNSPVTVVGDVIVAPGATLTIEKGVTVKFAPDSDSLNTGTDTARAEILVRGKLSAIGTAAEPIVFTSGAATKNVRDWGGILLDAGSDGSRLERCEISFSGEHGVRILSTSTIDHCSIYRIWNRGISVSGSSPTVSWCRIFTNSIGVSCEAGGNPLIHDSSIVLNNSFAVAGGGVLGLAPGSGGNYIAGNAGAPANSVDRTGYSAQVGTQDSVMDTSSETPPVQILRVDTIKAALDTDVSGGGVD